LREEEKKGGGRGEAPSQEERRQTSMRERGGERKTERRQRARVRERDHVRVQKRHKQPPYAHHSTTLFHPQHTHKTKIQKFVAGSGEQVCPVDSLEWTACAGSSPPNQTSKGGGRGQTPNFRKENASFDANVLKNSPLRGCLRRAQTIQVPVFQETRINVRGWRCGYWNTEYLSTKRADTGYLATGERISHPSSSHR
jgi:hypothetical protein